MGKKKGEGKSGEGGKWKLASFTPTVQGGGYITPLLSHTLTPSSEAHLASSSSSTPQMISRGNYLGTDLKKP